MVNKDERTPETCRVNVYKTTFASGSHEKYRATYAMPVHNEGLNLPHVATEQEMLIFPGGGIYFWWQAGVVKALQRHYNMKNDNLTLSGASAGSISCVMAVCNIDMDHAMNVAVRLADEAGIFTRTGGLAGIWGDLIETWLHELLPPDCHITCSGKVHISVTSLSASLRPMRRHVVNVFFSKSDLIDACLTSVHIPYFIDGEFSHTYRKEKCLDGSLLFFLQNSPWCACDEFGENHNAFIFDRCMDKKLMQRKWGFLETIKKEHFKEMFSMGHAYGLRWIQKQKKDLVPTLLQRVWSHHDRT